MDIHTFARRHLGQYKVKGDEIIPTLCPICHGGTHHDKETFALNITKQTYNCRRGSCNSQGHYTQLCKEFGEEADRDFDTYKPVRTFKKPQTTVKVATNKVEEYLKIRKISKATIDKLQVGCDEKGNIVFPYFENGEMVFVKFRPSKKVEKGERKAWREEGGKPILWGMDLCTSDKPLIITEGEIDTLSCYEAGLENIVSVPSGSEDFTWVELCWDWLKQFREIIIFGDNDDPGKEMVRKLSLKLSDFTVSIVDHKYKDANELLYKEGPEAVLKAVDTAKEIPTSGILDMADVVPLDLTKLQVVPSGIQALDAATGGFMMGDLSVWTGKRGEGKSTLLSQMMIESVQAGQKVCCYSGEMRADRFQYWSHLQMAGKTNIKTYFDKSRGKDTYFVEKEIVAAMKTWYRGKFYLYDNNVVEKSEESSILKIFTYAVKKYDCKVFLIDNLMTARFGSGGESDFYRQQSNFVRDLVEFAGKYNVHIHLVAHPKKTKGGLENDDISGASEITNLAHNVFSVERIEEGKGYDVAVKILKHRWEGAKDTVGLGYCPVSRRLYQPSSFNMKCYGWESTENYKKIETIKDLECPF
ncbi:MAG TPA: bifunctional DNA primase/helicase [Ruminiclostridium sp.]